MDIKFITDICKKAGAIGLKYFGRTTGNLKKDNTLVTEADIEIEKYLRREVSLRYPDQTILGEEAVSQERVKSDVVWAIDPVDGTRAFHHGFPIWSVSVGVIKNGEAWMGAVYAPVLDGLYYTDGERSFYNKMELVPGPGGIDPNSCFLVPGIFSRSWDINYPGTCLALGSTALHLCYVGQGAAAGMFAIKAAIWDLAGGAAILRPLGISLRYLSGERASFKELYDGREARPLIVCPDANFEVLSRSIIQKSAKRA